MNLGQLSLWSRQFTSLPIHNTLVSFLTLPQTSSYYSLSAKTTVCHLDEGAEMRRCSWVRPLQPQAHHCEDLFLISAHHFLHLPFVYFAVSTQCCWLHWQTQESEGILSRHFPWLMFHMEDWNPLPYSVCQGQEKSEKLLIILLRSTQESPWAKTTKAE